MTKPILTEADLAPYIFDEHAEIFDQQLGIQRARGAKDLPLEVQLTLARDVGHGLCYVANHPAHGWYSCWSQGQGAVISPIEIAPTARDMLEKVCLAFEAATGWEGPPWRTPANELRPVKDILADLKHLFREIGDGWNLARVAGILPAAVARRFTNPELVGPDHIARVAEFFAARGNPENEISGPTFDVPEGAYMGMPNGERIPIKTGAQTVVEIAAQIPGATVVNQTTIRAPGPVTERLSIESMNKPFVIFDGLQGSISAEALKAITERKMRDVAKTTRDDDPVADPFALPPGETFKISAPQFVGEMPKALLYPDRELTPEERKERAAILARSFPPPVIDQSFVETVRVPAPSIEPVLTMDGYEAASKTTAVYPKLSISIDDGPLIDVPWLYPLLGIVGEVSELAELAKKLLRDDKGVLTDERRAKMQKELGDVVWYIPRMAEALGSRFAKIASDNLTKLFSRKARNVLHGDGSDR